MKRTFFFAFRCVATLASGFESDLIANCKLTHLQRCAYPPPAVQRQRVTISGSITGCALESRVGLVLASADSEGQKCDSH